MNNFPKVLNLFPIPLYVNKYTGDTSQVVDYFNRQEMNPANGPYGMISKNSYILDNPVCNPLSQWIKNCFREYALELMRYRFEDIVLSQSWLTYKEPGQFHKVHTHPNTLLAGVFYYDYEPGDASIVFSKNVRSYHRPYLEPSLHDDYQQHLYAQDEAYFTPEQNTLIIFPSWVSHGVPPNQTNKVRKALGVNALTKGTLGDRETISEIIFGRYA